MTKAPSCFPRSSRAVLPGLLISHEHRGFQYGYRQAVADLLAALVWETEAFLRDDSQAAETGSSTRATLDARRLLYRFEERLERHIQSLHPDAGYVSDGLGI